MSLKYCFQNEIHRISKAPEDFAALLKSMQEVFNTNFPTKFTIEYQDSEGDKIIIHNDEDYKLALESESSNSKKIVKLFINDAADMDNVSFITRESIGQPQESIAQFESKSFEILPEIKENESPLPAPVERKTLSIEVPVHKDNVKKSSVVEEQNVETQVDNALAEKQESEPVDLDNGIAVVEVQKAEVQSPASGIAVVSVRKTELQSPVSGISVVGVRKTELQSPVSGISVVGVRKVGVQSPRVAILGVQKAELQSPTSGVTILSVQKAKKRCRFAVEENQTNEELGSGISVVSVRKAHNTNADELDSGVSVLSVHSGNKKKAKKAKKIQKIAQDAVYQEIPNIALMVKELLDNSKPTQKASKKRSGKAVHSMVACDSCNAFPIIGDRFKCLVLEDFDLCSHCEKTVNHPYPLIKIKDESQYSYLDANLSKSKTKKSKKTETKKCQTELNNMIDELVGQLEDINCKDGNYLTNLATELVADFAKDEKEPEGVETPETAPFDLTGIVGDFMQKLGGGEILSNILNGFAEVIGMDQKASVDTTSQEKKEEVQKSEFSAEVLEKANDLLEIFPENDFVETCKYVAQNPDKILEELVLDLVVA